MDELKTIDELREDQLRGAYIELKDLKRDDPNYGKVMNEIKTLEEIKLSSEQAESNRLNNNAKISVEEEKIMVDRERNQIERKKVRSVWGQIGAYFVMGFGSFGMSYVLEPWFQKNPNIQRFSERCRDLILKK